jgi:hypothetical protein
MQHYVKKGKHSQTIVLAPPILKHQQKTIISLTHTQNMSVTSLGTRSGACGLGSDTICSNYGRITLQKPSISFFETSSQYLKHTKSIHENTS